MSLKDFFEKLAEIFDGKREIEKVAQRQLKCQHFQHRTPTSHVNLPQPIIEVMRRKSAHPICKAILEFPFDWRPPQTSNDLVYKEHSTFKSHVELLGPNGLVKSSIVRLGLYGMLPHSEYGIRTHPAEEIYIMLAGDCLWKKAESDYTSLSVYERAYHPSNIPHASKTEENAFMAAYVWNGDLSKDRYIYKGIQ